MRPAQKVRQRRTFWVSEVELANPDHIAAAKSFAMTEGQIVAEAGEEGLAVVGPGIATLLELDDVVADLPVGLGDLGIDGLVWRTCPVV